MKRGIIVLFAMVPLIFFGSDARAWCVVNGQQITEEDNPSINDAAQANFKPTPYGFIPVIFYNPNYFGSFPAPFQMFTGAHECAHHALGHLLTPTPNPSFAMWKEQNADCWAIDTLVSGHMISCGDFGVIQQTLANFGPGDWSHFPGGQRAFNLNSCLSAAGLHPPCP